MSREIFDPSNPAFKSLFAQETNKTEQSRLYHLIKIETGDDEEPYLYLVDNNFSVTFDGVEYERFPLAFSEISVSSDGSVNKATITIANVGRELMYFVERYNGLFGRRVIVRTVYEKFLDFAYTVLEDGSVIVDDNADADTTAYIEDEFIIDSYSADENAVVFNLDPVVDFSVLLPRRRFTSLSCYWRFRDDDTCGYQYSSYCSIPSGSTQLFVNDTTGFYDGNAVEINSVTVKNYIKYCNDLGATVWSRTGPTTATNNATTAPDGTMTASKLEGLGLGGKVSQKVINLLSGRYEPSFYIRRITTTGVVILANPADRNKGTWSINLASLSNGWERITRSHPAVTISSEFTDSLGSCGIQFSSTVSGGNVKCYVWGCQLEPGTVSNTLVQTTDEVASIANETLRRKVVGVDTEDKILSLDQAVNINVTSGTITHTTCAKDLKSCSERHNKVRFGGFPGISSSRYIKL